MIFLFKAGIILLTMKNLLFYSWDKVVKENKANTLNVLNSFLEYNRKGVPAKLNGNSFILNSYDILKGAYTEREKIDYLYLASLRNYFDYKYQGMTGLYLYFSDLAEERVYKNRALIVVDDYIKFKHEEYTDGN